MALDTALAPIRAPRPVSGARGRMERQVQANENREAWGRVVQLGRRVHLAVVAERPDIALDAAGQLVSLADRRLRQIGDDDAA